MRLPEKENNSLKLTADTLLQVTKEMEPEAVAMCAGLALDIVGLDKAALTDIISEEREHLRKLREVRRLLST